jgi:hypothetical protein
MNGPFTRAWHFAPTVVDYVAGRIGQDRVQACEALKEELANGTIGARGPIVDANASTIASEFWRFAALDPDGSAVDHSKLKRLPWVEFKAEDILRVWPHVAVGEPKGEKRSRGPRPSTKHRVIEEMRRSAQFHRLSEMKEDEMAATFKASRDTCRRARETVLSEK